LRRAYYLDEKQVPARQTIVRSSCERVLKDWDWKYAKVWAPYLAVTFYSRLALKSAQGLFLAFIAVQQRRCFHLSADFEFQPPIIYEVNRYE
jgi:hypothetical protein